MGKALIVLTGTGIKVTKGRKTERIWYYDFSHVKGQEDAADIGALRLCAGWIGARGRRLASFASSRLAGGRSQGGSRRLPGGAEGIQTSVLLAMVSSNRPHSRRSVAERRLP